MSAHIGGCVCAVCKGHYPPNYPTRPGTRVPSVLRPEGAS